VSEGVGRDEVRGRRGCLEGSLEEHVKWVSEWVGEWDDNLWAAVT
jgi:hypothetical protein